MRKRFGESFFARARHCQLAWSAGKRQTATLSIFIGLTLQRQRHASFFCTGWRERFVRTTSRGFLEKRNDDVGPRI